METMVKHYCFLCFTASLLCFCPFAFASEDSPSPFPDNMLISDLPELPVLPDKTEEPNISFKQTPIINPSQDSDIIIIPPKDIASQTDAIPFDDEQFAPKKITSNFSNTNLDLSSAKNVESDENAPIFVPNPENNNIADTVDNTQDSLTDALSNNKKQNIVEGTWIEKLASTNPLSAFSSENGDDELANLIRNARGKNANGRSNAAVFDISGVMLRMSLNQVEKILKNRSFQKINAKFTIPNFIKWRNEETCSSQGIIGYERLQSCISTMAKKDGHEYLYYLKYAKFDSKEEIEVFLTSNFTENKVHKIIYRSKIPNVVGSSPKATYIRNIKIYDFWKKINQKYGDPDDKVNVTWGLGGNKPFLKATTGYLLLEDPMFVEMDYTRMSREDQRYIHSDYYNF